MTAASLLTGRGAARRTRHSTARSCGENPPPLVNSNDRSFLSARVGCITINEAHGQGPLLNVVCIK